MKKDWLKISGMHEGATPGVFRNAEKLRNAMTDPEKKLWEYLKSKPMGFKFRRQYPIAGYVLDFYCHKLRLSIELHGGYHLGRDQKVKDSERTDYLRNIGIAEIRFINKQVLEDYKTVIKKIDNNLRVGLPL